MKKNPTNNENIQGKAQNAVYNTVVFCHSIIFPKKMWILSQEKARNVT